MNMNAPSLIEKTHLMQFIQESDPYSALAMNQLELLQSKIKILTLEKGKFTYLPGHPSNQIYLIYSGSVRMVNFIENGKEFTSSLYNVGETFGELSLAGETIRGETAISCEKTVLISFKSDDLKELLEQNILFTLRLMRLIGARRHESENKLLQLFYAPVHSRLAKLLIHIATKRVKAFPLFPIQLRLTHEILASLAGTTRETTTVILNRFEKLGLIRKTKGAIFINDLQSLKALAQDRAAAEMAPTGAIPHVV
jgi:CRP-like cAMP-binding protein